jgi:hypothetical protein
MRERMNKPAKLLIEHTYRTPVGQLARPAGEWQGWLGINIVLSGLAVCQLATLITWIR